MYKIFVISYSGNNSEIFEKEVKTLPSWLHFSKDNYLICVQSSAKEIRTKLESKILQGKDKLLVLEVDIKDVEGWLKDDDWNCLKSERALTKK